MQSTIIGPSLNAICRDDLPTKNTEDISALTLNATHYFETTKDQVGLSQHCSCKQPLLIHEKLGI